MKKLVLLFSHKLTDKQIGEAKKKLKCSKIIYLPDNLQNSWSNIPPNKKLSKSIINPFIKFLEANSEKEDFVLIQGEYGITFYLVEWCFKNKRIPLYSTTPRKSVEKKLSKSEIKKEALFSHIQFRKYIQYK